MSHPPRVRSNSAARAAGDWGQVVPRRRRGRPEEESSKVVHLVDTEEFEDLGLDGSELRCEDHGRAIERLPEDAGFRGRLSQRARPVRWENTMKTDSGSPEFRDAAYLYMLRALPLRDLTTVLGCFPTPEILREASSQERLTRLGVPLSERMGDIITRWDVLAEKARVTIDRSMANGIHALSLLSNTYPELLRLIPDPPPLLFVRGSVGVLSEAGAVAVVGTREPSERGRHLAHHIARHLAGVGFGIVSGLAKGIDTCAHEGALAAGGRTIAVLGTPPDHIYPAENTRLAARILDEGGALVSEQASGEQGGRQAFVRRDRIQSGLAVGVVAVQTDITGGTMHTVKFAEKQGRVLLAPRPSADEAHMRQCAGISELIRTGRARAFDGMPSSEMVRELDARRAALVPARMARLHDKGQ